MIRRVLLRSGGFVVLAVLLMAGAAQSLSGSNTVFSDDIVDGTIAHVDVKPNSLGGSRFMDNSVTGGKILNNTITGDDVNESQLNLSRNCSVGMIQGAVRIHGTNLGMPNTYSESFRDFTHNCNGGKVLVRKIGVGHYDVKWEGSGHRGAIATVDHSTNPNHARTATIGDFGAGEIFVHTYNAAGALVDANVEVLFW